MIKNKNHINHHEKEGGCCEGKCSEEKNDKIIYFSIISILFLSLLNLFFLIGVNTSVLSMQAQLDKGIVADLGEEGCVVDFGNNDNNLGENKNPQENTFNLANADDDAFEGSANAPVTIIEFSDFECPYCESFYSGALVQLRKEYIETGKVKIIFRDFPLSFHADAQKAAEAAECAGEQNKYYEMHDKLFENQSNISVADIKNYAIELKLDSSMFNACLDSGAMASEVAADFKDGQALGVSGTPTFFINGQKLVGAQPFSAFKQIIDAELAK
ncbi:MAG: thioredoxin domain-containing protein [archaeon]|jgi:protein-disulfide isomerase